ncbi:MAG: response regulator [Erythrobacter sp.]|uniref:response regulator n=1 Tax=Erythrobacter sp. TaxID=1042 RepID=UPI002621520E|nr:response regulator [Erythrobacter sp.]MDJ0979781.1 response regulator [Erythrobacter sp.]
MAHTILLLEDEPLILMDLEYAAEDLGCHVLPASTTQEALDLIAAYRDALTVAVLDVSLGERTTCFAVAQELERLETPFILHSGDLDRHDERIRELGAELVAKPAPADRVIATAIAYAQGDDPRQSRLPG